MEGKKILKKFINFLKSKKRFFLISASAALIVGAGLFIVNNKVIKLKQAAVSCNNINTDVFVGSNPDWCKGQDVVLKRQADGSDTHVFLNGTHEFKSLTMEPHTNLGLVKTENNFAVEWHGFFELKKFLPGSSTIFVNGDNALRICGRNANTDDPWRCAQRWQLGPPTTIRVDGLTGDLIEFRIQYFSGQGEAEISFGGSEWAGGWIMDWSAGVYGKQYLYLNSTKTPHQCGDDEGSYINGICGDYYVWANFDKDNVNASFDPTHKVTTARVEYLDAGNIPLRAGGYGGGYGYFGLYDPIPRTQKFASLTLNINGDVNINGIIEIPGGRNGGPYSIELSDQGVFNPYNFSGWPYVGRLNINAQNIQVNGGLITADGLPGGFNLAGHYRDGGNGGVVLLNAPSGNINFSGQITTRGGKGGTAAGGGGGGGSGGVIRIIANSSNGITGLDSSGGDGGSGGMVKGGGRPGRSLFSTIESMFLNDPSGHAIIPECWRSGDDCKKGGRDLYKTVTNGGYISYPGLSSDYLCNPGGIQSLCSQHGGYGGTGGALGSSGGAGGDGNCGGHTQGGGGGGGAGGIIIIALARSFTDTLYQNAIHYNSADGGYGGQGSGNCNPRSGSCSGSDGGETWILGINRVKLSDVNYLSTFAFSGACGKMGGGGNGGNGGGGASGILNITNYSPSAPTGATIIGDVHASGNILVNANATGVVTSGGAIQNIISDLNLNLKNYTIDSNSDANWSTAKSKITDIYGVLNRLKKERAKNYDQMVGNNLNPDCNPEGGVWYKSGDLTLESLGFSGRGTIIVEGNITINGDVGGSANGLGLISEKGKITIGSTVRDLKAALFAPNGDIIIEKRTDSATSTIRGLLVAKSIAIKRGGISIVYDSTIAQGETNICGQLVVGSALPGFSEILAPTWREETP